MINVNFLNTIRIPNWLSLSVLLSIYCLALFILIEKKGKNV